MSFWGELRRRNVVKVAAAYAVVGWLLVQVADTLLPAFGAPPWVLPVSVLLLGMGFVVALVLSWAYELTPQGMVRTETVPLSESITKVTGRNLDFAIIGALVLALGFVVADNYVLDDGSSETSFLPNSIAVIPFRNDSPDSDNAYYASGIHEEILNQLVKLSALSVIGRTSVEQYTNTDKSIPEIARELNVETVMGGGVRYAGGRIRITTQLNDGVTGAQLWSETYTRDFDDIFAVESDIAMNVANSMAVEFSDEEQQRIEKRPTNSVVAYELLLQANSLVGLGNQAARIHELLDQATAIDPEFAAAYGAKAQIYALELSNTLVGSARSWTLLEPLVREFVDKALALDPEQVDAFSALAQLASRSWRWTEAKQAYDRAYEISNSRGAEEIWFTAWSGNLAEALKISERRVGLDRFNWVSHWVHGIVLQYAGDYDAAAAKFRDAIALTPALPTLHSGLASAEIARGNMEEARRELELTEQLLGENRPVITLVNLCYGFGRISDGDNARRLFDEISAIADQGQEIGTGGWATAHLAVGNLDEALEWLERGAENASRHEPDAGYFQLMNLKLNFEANEVLNQPAFADVLNRIRGD